MDVSVQALKCTPIPQAVLKPLFLVFWTQQITAASTQLLRTKILAAFLISLLLSLSIPNPSSVLLANLPNNSPVLPLWLNMSVGVYCNSPPIPFCVCTPAIFYKAEWFFFLSKIYMIYYAYNSSLLLHH